MKENNEEEINTYTGKKNNVNSINNINNRNNIEKEKSKKVNNGESEVIKDYIDEKNKLVKVIKDKKEYDESLMEMNTEFDENIYFSHYCNVYRKMEFENPISGTMFPFLMSREFLYSLYEDKKTIKEADKESIAQIMGRIKQFSNSRDEKFNKVFLDNIKSYAEIIGIDDTSNFLIPALAKIVDDKVNMKIKFLQVLLPFIDYLCSNGDKGYKILRNNMINIIEELYHNRSFEIKDEEYKTLLFQNFVKISKHVIPKDNDKYTLNMVIGFGNEDIKTNPPEFVKEHKQLCIKFISELCEEFGQDSAENYLLPQLTFFVDENDIDIKKEVLYTLPNLCEVLSYDLISTKIYNLLKKVSTDPIWTIRKACVEVLSKILKIFKEKCLQNPSNLNINNNKVKNIDVDLIEKNKITTSATHFVNLIETFILDNQKYVRNTVLENIGEIISPLDKQELSQKLFDFYKNSADNYYFNLSKLNDIESKEINNDKDINESLKSEKIPEDKNNNKNSETKSINYYFAYNFPAVLYCYGSEYWNKLKNIYFNLCNEKDIKIRRSIIASFHEISMIVGKDITVNELLPIYNKFLESKDKLEKNLSIRNLPKILAQVNKETKEKYFKYFDAVSIFQDNMGSKIRNFNFINWKNKLDVIEGILCYYNLYDNDIIYKSIMPQCISFCFDEVSKVRYKSSKVLGTLISFLYSADFKKNELFKVIEIFALNKKFHQRICFIKMCKILLNNVPLYREFIMNLLFKIIYHEKILNVRISIGKVLKKIIENDKASLWGEPSIHKMCYLILNNNGQKNKTINNIFNDVNIKTMFNGENIINMEFYKENEEIKKDKKYFNLDNDFFKNEFKLTLNEEFGKKSPNNDLNNNKALTHELKEFIDEEENIGKPKIENIESIENKYEENINKDAEDNKIKNNDIGIDVNKEKKEIMETQKLENNIQKEEEIKVLQEKIIEEKKEKEVIEQMEVLSDKIKEDKKEEKKEEEKKEEEKQDSDNI